MTGRARRRRRVLNERGGLVVACLALSGVIVLSVVPLRAYGEQRRQHQAAEAEVQALTQDNRVLEDRASQLESPAEVERLAREQYGLVKPGEEVYAVLGPPAPPPPPEPPPAPPERERSWWEKGLDAVTSVL